jgi:hypothetical protein
VLTTNALALKEWAVVVEALARGKQILLLRKGGLYERQGRFSTEPTEFFFFPTYVHQMEQGVIPEAAPELQAASQHRPASDQLIVTRYATVTSVRWIEARERVEALAGLHCWTAETVEKRFTYKKPGLYLFMLRVYQLPQVYTLPSLKRYVGCRSWVDLAESLGTEGAAPVLDDEAFAARVREVNDRLAL